MKFSRIKRTLAHHFLPAGEHLEGEADVESSSVARIALVNATVYALVVVLLLFIAATADVLLMLFGGILLAILFHKIAHWIHAGTRINERLALAGAILLPLLALGLGAWAIAPDIGDQIGKLSERLPRAAERLREQLMQYELVARVWESTNQLRALAPDDSDTAQYVANFFSSTLGVFGNLLFALVVGLFLSLQPALYIKGLLLLVPSARQERARQVLCATGTMLGNWLLAKLASMALVGVLTTAGLMLLGIDLALILGLIAALLSFIPNFGPILSVIPAALIALVEGPERALYVLVLYAAVQAVETYGLTPFLQQKLADMPPALLLTMQVLFGVVAGIAGVVFATPLTVAAMVMIRMWYVEDILHKRPAGAGEGAH
ncbi:AI-2E family transporter [Massilia sp. UMI-21]|nr:AI-2E family transporter [Massilia sp. UMI-21]